MPPNPAGERSTIFRPPIRPGCLQRGRFGIVLHGPFAAPTDIHARASNGGRSLDHEAAGDGQESRTGGVARLSGGTELHALCRALDWAATSLGPVERWSSSLRTAVRLCLDSPLAMSVWAGPELVLVYNDGYATKLGRGAHPWALGRPAREVWDGSWDRLGPALERVMQRGESSVREEQRLVSTRGGGDEGSCFTCSHVPIREDDGRIVGSLHTIHETTARVRAEQALRESEAKYRSLFSSIDEGFCIIELVFDGERPIDYRFLEVNPAFERHTGLANATGRLMRELVPEHDEHWFQIYGRVAQTGESVRFENPATALGRFYDVYAFRVGVPEERRVAVLFGDITARKQAEERLRESDRRKDEYLAMLGHELRNPLGAIRSATELLAQSGAEDPHVRRVYELLERQSSHMSRIIDGLLDVSRIAQGKIHLELGPLDVRGVVEKVLDTWASPIATSGLELRVVVAPQPLWVTGDDARLVQVLENLIGNALKFTPPPGTIIVAVEHEGGLVAIRVRDTGVGIRRERLSSIFEAFEQEAQDMARSAGGLGLGLALAKGLVELHHGTIQAHSAGRGAGAELVVRLPLVAAPVVPEEVAAPRGQGDAPPRRVLLVEDNVDAAQMLSDLLELSGNEVTVAACGREALEALRRRRVDVVLCDLGIPDMSGYEVARAVRADPSLRDTPLVAVTGYGQPEDRRRTAAAGFDDHLTKPVDLGALHAVLRRFGGDRSAPSGAG